MNKGLIVDVKNKYSIVLTEDMSYIKVKNKGVMVKGKTISFFKEDLYVENRSYMNVAIAACLALLMIIGLPMLTIDSFVESYAVVSLDINPSFQYEVNSDYQVTEVFALNEDAEGLLDETWLGKPLKVVLMDAIAKAAEAEYLTEDRDVVLLSFASVEETEELEGILESVTESDDINFIIIETDMETVEAAEDEEVSVGRKALSKELDKEDPEAIDLSNIEEEVEKFNQEALMRWIDNKARVEKMQQEKKQEQESKQEEKQENKDNNKPDTPPGQEKKNGSEGEEFVPPGQEKKDDHVPPGQTKKEENSDTSDDEAVEKLPPGQEKKGNGSGDNSESESKVPPGQEKKDNQESNDEEVDKVPPGQEKKDSENSDTELTDSSEEGELDDSNDKVKENNGNSDHSKEKSNNGSKK